MAGESDYCVVRIATARDAPALLDVITGAFEQYHGKLDPPSSAMSKSLDVVLEEMRDSEVLMAECSDAAIACIFFRVRGDVVCWDRLSVLPPWRRRGIATRLITAVEETARHRGIRALQLEVRLSLVDLHAFYERLGYVAVSTHSHPGYREPTFQTMEKTIKTR